jgi:hypothetical protein
MQGIGQGKGFHNSQDRLARMQHHGPFFEEKNETTSTSSTMVTKVPRHRSSTTRKKKCKKWCRTPSEMWELMQSKKLTSWHRP